MQALAEICIRRPVFATMIILSLTVIGAVSFGLLGVDRFPNVDLPIVTVTTTNPGASAEEIEREVTDRIEGTVNTVSGIEDLRSTSAEGISQVIIQFTLGKNVDTAAAEVRQKVDLVLNDLPRTADKPLVQKINSDAADVLLYALRSPRPLVSLTEFADKQIIDRLESVSGVGNARIFGGRQREIEVRVDPARLRAFGLTVADLTAAIREQNIELPGGSVDEASRRLTIRTLGRHESVAALGEIAIANRNGYAVKVRDVADVRDGAKEAKSVARQNGESAIVIGIQKQSGMNTVAVIDAVKERVAEIQATLPSDVKLDLVRDQSEFIRASLHSIEEHLIVGGFLAAGVVFLFLRNWRSTIIAAIAIPTSIIAAFACMKALGYTLNMMTMLALTLMVGIVIDDAIVVLENIYRFVEEKGMNPFQAAIEGTREIGLAVMATTLSLLAVFVPIGFMGGIVGQFMQSFGFTCAAAIAVSLLVSFTLTPTLAARWIKPGEHAAPQETALDSWLKRHYRALLVWSMANRGKVVTLCLLVIASIVPLAMLAGFTFIAEDDENEFEVSVRMPEGTSLAAAESVMEDMARRIRTQLAGVQSTLTVPGYNAQEQMNAGTIFVRLTQANERDLSQKQLIAEARKLMVQYPKNIYTSVQAVNPFAGGDRNNPIQFILSGPDLKKLDEYSARLLEHMRKDPNMVDADRSLLPGKPELRVRIDRARAADLDVRVEDIAATINTLFAGERTSNFSEGKNQYDIRVRALASVRQDRDAILSLMIPSSQGAPVELRQVASLEESTGPGTIDRFQRQRQVTLFANTAPGGSQSDAVESIRVFADNMRLEPGYRQALSGDVKEMEKTGFYFLIAVGLTFTFMYMVLAAQFESFIHPVTILLTLPLSIPFALLSSALAGQMLNIFSMLGILLLFGVVKKNAILQIDHTNTLRAHGMPRYDAIIQANLDRLRPILMTTIALVAGMVPLVVGTGPGAETNRSIGVLVVGGQSLCLLLTLLAVPVFYSLFEDAKEWIAGRFRRATHATPASTPTL